MTTIDSEVEADATELGDDQLGVGDDPPSAEPRRLDLVFEGKAREYFKVWIVNLCLTLLTAGVFSAWAKVRKKRFVYSHTHLDGTPFEYLGRPVPILKGRIVATTLLVAWTIVLHARPTFTPLVLAVGALLLPWVLVRSAQFNARSTAYRNLTLEFSASYWDGLKMMLSGALITLLTFGLGFPLWRHRLARFLVRRTSYGQVPAAFGTSSKPFVSAYWAAFLLLLLALVPIAFLVRVFAKNPSDSSFVTALLPGYVAYGLAYVVVQTRTRNAIWNGTVFGPVSFRSTLRVRDVFWLYLTNAVAILASAGLLVPWAEMRMLRYRTARLAVYLDGSLREFRGARSAAAAATGAEVADLFELDVAL